MAEHQSAMGNTIKTFISLATIEEWNLEHSILLKADYESVRKHYDGLVRSCDIIMKYVEDWKKSAYAQFLDYQTDNM